MRRRGGHATGTKRTSQGEKRYLAERQGGVDEGRKLCLAQGPGNLRRDLRWYAKYGTDAYRRTVQNGDAESGRSSCFFEMQVRSFAEAPCEKEDV